MTNFRKIPTIRSRMGELNEQDAPIGPSGLLRSAIEADEKRKEEEKLVPIVKSVPKTPLKIQEDRQKEINESTKANTGIGGVGKVQENLDQTHLSPPNVYKNTSVTVTG